MIHFNLIWALALLPLPLLVYLLPAKKQIQAAPLRMPSLIKGLATSEQAQQQRKTSPLLLALIWLLLILACAQPQWLGDAVNIPAESREMMIAVDLSGSMQIEDMQLNGRQVNRLDMLKVLLGDFIERRTGDRLGLILFADDAYMQTPMTFDRKTVKQMLDEAVLGLVGEKTAIGDAIALAVKRFTEKNKSNRVLLLLTDGQNTAGKISPAQALELAVSEKITIYTVGIGADVMIQEGLFGKRRVNPSSELDEDTLTDIAKQTGGEYFRARNSEELEKIYQLLDQLEPVEQEQQQMRPLTALYYWPLGFALLLTFVTLIFNFYRHQMSSRILSREKSLPQSSSTADSSTNKWRSIND